MIMAMFRGAISGMHAFKPLLRHLDLHLKLISAVATFYRKFPVEFRDFPVGHRASCRVSGLPCRRSAPSGRKTVCSCRRLCLLIEDPNHKKNLRIP